MHIVLVLLNQNLWSFAYGASFMSSGVSFVTEMQCSNRNCFHNCAGFLRCVLQRSLPLLQKTLPNSHKKPVKLHCKCMLRKMF